jgi:hypothetical protein
MKNEQKEIGKRLKDMRNIFNNGYKCSIEQFSEVLSESKYNISNYELGKANIPNRTLNSLYSVGINPIFILTGEGDAFAPNQAGKDLKEKCQKADKQDVEFLDLNELEAMSSEDLIKIANQYQSVAGNILNILSGRK